VYKPSIIFYSSIIFWGTRLHKGQDPSNLVQAINKEPSEILLPIGYFVVTIVEPTLLGVVVKRQDAR
jgi:hypothetical protein